jgi:ATP adenylyltransferase
MIPTAPYDGAVRLEAAVEDRTRQAIAAGVLAPIETVAEVVAQDGVRFVVRRVSSLARKHAGPPTPLVPWDERLFVADVPPAHAMILNKFPVIARHALVVTRRFVPQEALLDGGDFAALAACFADWDALAFYNGGREAGASQPHKHLQLVPRGLGEAGELPIAPLLARAEGGTVPGLRFPHAFARCEAGASAEARLAVYLRLLEAIGVRELAGGLQSAPYNLLATREWMLAVPRAREKFEGISVNALGFAGSLFVRDEAEAARVRATGPMVLAAVAGFPVG